MFKLQSASPETEPNFVNWPLSIQILYLSEFLINSQFESASDSELINEIATLGSVRFGHFTFITNPFKLIIIFIAKAYRDSAESNYNDVCLEQHN